ncbi:hypothetical protein M0804_010872 [Polistes exclamans]|nr:hypothetical protein M0804_010872 [Polistes exclamans]
MDAFMLEYFNATILLAAFNSSRGVGSGATKQTLFYVEVTDDMHTHPGGGAECEGELIELVEMNIEEAENYITSGEVQSLGPLFLRIKLDSKMK